MNEHPNIASKKPRTGMMAAITLAIKVIAAATTYVFTFVLAHTMDVADFGIVGALLNATFLLSVVGVMGQRLVLLRFIPPYLGGEDRAGMTGIINRAFQVAGAGTMALFAVVSIVTLVAGLLGYVENWPILIFGYLLIPLQGWIDMQAHLSRAYRSIVLALLPKEVLWRGLTGVAVVAMFLAGGGRTVELPVVVGGLVFVLIALILGQSWVMQKQLNLPRLRLSARSTVSETWRSALIPFWVSSVSAILFTNIDVVLVAVLFGGESAGYYFAANRVAQILTFFLLSYNIVIGPMLSEAHARGDSEAVAATVSSAAIQAFIPTAVCAVALIAAAPYVLQLFGPEFVQAAGLLQILLVAGIINAALGPGDLVLTMCGKEKAAMHVSMLTMGIGIAVVVAGGLVLGVQGIAGGTLVALTLRKLLFWWVAYKHLNIGTDVATAIILSAKPATSPRG